MLKTISKCTAISSLAMPAVQFQSTSYQWLFQKQATKTFATMTENVVVIPDNNI